MAVTITDLLAYRLHRVANHISRSAALRYKAGFDVSLGEWRTIALLGAQAPSKPPISLGELARAAGLDKGRTSRVVSALVARKLAMRRPDANDRRSVRLVLTREGRRVYRGLLTAANERNSRLLGCLSRAEHAALTTILRKLDAEARALVHDERARAARQRGAR